jgi:hypothetical protein
MVSELCLGTMTFGEQNSEAQAHEQLDMAVAAGVNFIDTAEIYPVPPRAETQGLTERYIGTWLKRRGGRDRLILASKVAGPGTWISYLRDGRNRLDRPNIAAALDASLARLQTDTWTSISFTGRTARPISSASSAMSRPPRTAASRCWKPWRPSLNRSRQVRSAMSACPTRPPGAS